MDLKIQNLLAQYAVLVITPHVIIFLDIAPAPLSPEIPSLKDGQLKMTAPSLGDP